MSTTTMNLPCVRFVKRMNNGALGSKYSYIAMMAENAKALESAPWRESSVPLQNVTMPVNKVTETDAVYDESGAMISPPSFSAFASDAFDCFQQGGDARREDGTMCGYAGCVAYRFKIPNSATSSSISLSSVSLQIQRDRYCRAGVRVVLVRSSDANPSDNWDVVRGVSGSTAKSQSTSSNSLGVTSWGFLGQSSVKNLVSGRAADGTITFNSADFPAISTSSSATYLWVYLTLEDYQSYWTMYNAKEARYYSIEGSAMLVASKADFTFNGTVHDDVVSGFVTAAVGGIGNIRNYHESGQSSPSNVSVFGHSFCCANTSAVYFSSQTADVINAMLNLDLLDAKPSLVGAPFSIVDVPSSGHSSITVPSVPAESCDIIGALKSSATYNYVSMTIASKAQEGSNSHGCFLASTMMRICYGAYVVPTDREKYDRIKVNNVLVTRYGDCTSVDTTNKAIDCDLILWRSSSKAFFGPWREVAMTALARNSAFFTGSSTSISGEVAGNGEVTENITVRADAKFLMRIPITGTNGGTVEFNLPNPVRSSEVIVVVPCLRGFVTTGINNERIFSFFTENGNWAYWQLEPNLAFK